MTDRHPPVPPLTPAELETLKVMQGWLRVLEDRTYDHIAQSFRWLLASLFAANGGAIAALLSDHALAVKAHVALVFFCVGLVLSIGVGVATSLTGYRASVRLNQIRADVDTMLLSHVKNENTMARIDAMKPTWRTFFPSYVGIASLACLIAGLVAAASGL